MRNPTRSHPKKRCRKIAEGFLGSPGDMLPLSDANANKRRQKCNMFTPCARFPNVHTRRSPREPEANECAPCMESRGGVVVGDTPYAISCREPFRVYRICSRTRFNLIFVDLLDQRRWNAHRDQASVYIEKKGFQSRTPHTHTQKDSNSILLFSRGCSSASLLLLIACPPQQWWYHTQTVCSEGFTTT
jgi:hypothetical protein